MAFAGLHKTPAAAFFRRSGIGWEWMVVPTAGGGSLFIPSGPEDSISEASRQLEEVLDDFSGLVDRWDSLTSDAARGYVDTIKACGRKLTHALFAGRQDEFAAEMKLQEF